MITFKNLRDFTAEALIGWLFLIFAAAVVSFVVGLAIGFGFQAFDFAMRIAFWTFVVSAPGIVVSYLVDPKYDAVYSGYLLLGFVGGVVGLAYSIYLAVAGRLPASSEMAFTIAKIAFVVALFGAMLGLPEMFKHQNRR